MRFILLFFLLLLFFLSSVSKPFFPSASSCDLFVKSMVQIWLWLVLPLEDWEQGLLSVQLSTRYWCIQGTCKKGCGYCESVDSLFLFSVSAVCNDLNNSQKHGKVRETYFISDVAVACFFVEKRHPSYFMRPWICLFNHQIVMWMRFYSCSFLFYFDGLPKLSTS